ncbi:unnamed protein product [Adineta steineri]|uniref:Phospholipase n=1 Tax=Adineta steineri TaxID=433720 RepID=A0A813TXC6_9BILA|nr:unnamed protein product [Adineta steineri]CAF1076052.1 unnamed protein product [Adineta steineri]
MSNQLHTSGGIDSLVKHTAEMVDMTLTSSNANQRHVEYLPYPDWNFVEELDTPCQDDQCPLDQVYTRRNKTFVRGLPVEVTKIEAERVYNPVTEFLYPYLYTITVRHGPQYEWTIMKRYKHFHDLHKSLVRYVETETGRSMSSLNKSQLSEVITHQDENQSLIKKQDDQPCFPTHNDRIAFINESSVSERCKSLQNYLNKVLKHPKFREQIAVREFFEVSPLSFVHGLGKSVKEGAIAKRSNDDFRGRSIFLRAPFMCDKCKFHHGQKWFVLKDSYMVYMNPDSALVGFPMLIDRTFSLEQGFRKTGTNNGIRIKNLQRSMIIKFEKDDERDAWFNLLNNVKNNCSLIEQHPFNSFAPKRQRQYGQWFVNGQSYMEAVAKGILAAKEEIFITDWWLSPEISLIRPFGDDSMRLDNLLGKRAEEGIRVYIMVFKDIVQVVGLNSWHTKAKLVAKSPTKKNIKVIRHPDHRVLPGTESSFLYSHHEKTVVIDQRIAFIGGIDLCWGRWDTDSHRLIDLSDENVTELKLPEQIAREAEEEAHKQEAAVETTEKMADNSNNTNINSSSNITAPLLNSTKSNEKEKDTSLKSNKISSVDAAAARLSAVTDFKTELNEDEKKILAEEDQAVQESVQYKKKWRKMLKRHRKKSQNDDSFDEDEEIPMEPIDEKPKTIIGITPVADDKCRYFMGKDYSNSYEKDFEFIEKFDEDYIDRKASPRMPWHDEALVVSGEAARDCARHFIQRWNIHKADKFRFVDSYPYLLPKSYNDNELLDYSMLTSILGEERKPICIDAQCVRSVSFWSCGTRTVEHSIQNAYIHMIDSAQHFIYIENQFFVSIANDATIKNNIGDALYRRIIRASINKEKFRVYIVVPLLPGFSNANAVQAVLYFIMRSINKGETSLYQRLRQSGVNNPEDYITFYGMRNWDILMGSLVTEIIYVHSKLMIVDDRMCICGSANINDRSLQGSRDSEFCLVVSDTEMIDSKLNGQTQKVGTFSSTWRKKLFRQLLGIKKEEDMNVDDPCSDEFYNYFRDTAKNNAQIYEEVFNTLPTNRVREFAQVESYVGRPKLKQTDPLSAHEKCKQIQGFIVEFPLEFLADDVLMPKWNTSEGMAPILLWT